MVQLMAGVLLITKKIETRPAGGRELLCKLNRDCLKDIFGEDLHILELDGRPLTGVCSFIGAFRGHIDGLNSAVIAEAVRQIRTNRIGLAFVDGSNLGEVAAALRKDAPGVSIITFFHNVESRFFLGSLMASPSLRALVVMVVNYLGERKAVRCSDRLIALNRRDSDFLRSIYGRSADYIAPMSLEDKLPQATGGQVDCARIRKEKYILFVGGAFYANRLGAAWFIKHVVPHIGIRTIIVGKGLEVLRHDGDPNAKIEVIGEVQNLAEWYLDAHLVVAPIFDGSGMKTKVAEALMFGKKVVGAPEAFSGYEDVAEKVGWICATADDFIETLNRLEHAALPRFDHEVRALFERRYSYEAARARLAHALEAASHAAN
ncbi:glycosyltransferase family 4 protein [Methylocystis sp. H62]|uniref:glycosyltransferase n=1 Tax=Methylocystis sp. H62 TaxID=2785789 RepID=UPI0018C21B0B|nr:glycosyltransferase family 4 protein [Methylocystis sp. H62]MBG0792642.1 glycosyltransferase family 4 protein [Methylocystis sp. H62]